MAAILKSGACAHDSNIIRTLSEVMSREMLQGARVKELDRYHIVNF